MQTRSQPVSQAETVSMRRKEARKPRTTKRGGLFINDTELIELLGVPEEIARTAIRHLDAKGVGFPPKQLLWGNRRFWPAVEHWFLVQNGVIQESLGLVRPYQQDGDETPLAPLQRQRLAPPIPAAPGDRR